MDNSAPAFDTTMHFQNLRRWLEMEGEAERERLEERRRTQSGRNAERSGETLLDLVVDSHTVGLGGRFLLKMVKRRRGTRLPWHRFRVGSPVIVSADGDADGRPLSGVVSARDTHSVQVATEHWPEADRLRLDLSPDEVTRRRQLAALKTAEQARGRMAQLRDVFLSVRTPVFRTHPVTLPDISDSLNESQKAAIEFAMNAQDLAIIHGPPGTGKTTTLVELIRLAVLRGERVLACAPSNTAVDNLLERLVQADVNAVRLGHPARVHQVVRSHSLDALVEQSEFRPIIEELLREAETLERRAARSTRGRHDHGRKQHQQRREARELRRESRLLEQQAVSDVLDTAQVVCATVSFDFSLLDGRKFDLLVIDEACQSVEPGCWVPLSLAERVVLAGDHCQLPPTILSTEAAKEGFDISLMQRLVEYYADTVTRQLTVQYRMHEQIMQFSSEQFYGGRLTADTTVRHHRLNDLPRIQLSDDRPVTFIDTAGAGWTEEVEPNGFSKLNPQEGRLVLQQVQELISAGLSPQDIAVIAPYAAQVRWLRQQSEYDLLEIDTVDGFQGREKEAVVISTVRSNDIGEIGFLADARRMNVALTRARRRLVVVGDSATLGADEFFQSLLQWFEKLDAYRTVWEFNTLL